MPESLREDGRELSASDIADLAGVSPSAVSNWRKRHHDFPQPLDRPGRWLRFQHTDVVMWLTRHGRLPELTSEPQTFTDELRRCIDSFRGDLTPTRALLVAAAHHADLINEDEEVRTEFAVLGQFDEAHIAKIVRDHQMLAESFEEVAEAVDEILSSHAGRVAEEGTTRPEVSAFLARLLVDEGDECRVGAESQLEVYDPCVGVGRTLNAVADLCGDAQLIGQEINDDFAKLAMLRAILRRREADIRIGDTISEDRHSGRLVDYGIADPPMGLRIADDVADDPRWLLGEPGRDGTSAWIQVLLSHLNETGRAVVTVEPGWASRSGSRHIRSALIRQNLLDAVIALPSGSVRGTGFKPLVLVLDRSRATRPRPPGPGEVVFFDLNALGGDLDEELLAACTAGLAEWRTDYASTGPPSWMTLANENESSAIVTRMLKAVEDLEDYPRELWKLRGAIEVIMSLDDLDPADLETLTNLYADVIRVIAVHLMAETVYEEIAESDFDITPRRYVHLRRPQKSLNEALKGLEEANSDLTGSADSLASSVSDLVSSSTHDVYRPTSFSLVALRELMAKGELRIVEGISIKRDQPVGSDRVPVLSREWLADGALMDHAEPGEWITPEEAVDAPHCELDDVIVCLAGEDVGRTRVVLDEQGWCLGPGLAALRLSEPSGGLSPEYLKLWFDTDDCWAQIRHELSGTYIQRLNVKSLRKLLISVPGDEYLSTLQTRLNHLTSCRIHARDVRHSIRDALSRETDTLDALIGQAEQSESEIEAQRFVTEHGLGE
ncbi:MAG: N-6 DNA methylase [Gemmatimonadales bacterium]|nr:N-6 DNA methylase [Gemmatimonadales bacterium]MBT7692405.1 N-6 DNA methylase [Gemmatimonadales bacterium]